MFKRSHINLLLQATDCVKVCSFFKGTSMYRSSVHSAVYAESLLERKEWREMRVQRLVVIALGRADKLCQGVCA